MLAVILDPRFRQPTFYPRDGRFYPRLVVAGRGYALGGFATVWQAATAYEAARMRVRRGEPVQLRTKEKPDVASVRRWYRPPAQSVHFGDREGELVGAVEADQEQSMFILHNALDRFHPSVRKFVLVASNTGDPAEAAHAAGLNESQVAVPLPRLKTFFGPLLH